MRYLCVFYFWYSFFHTSHSFESVAWFCLQFVQFCGCSMPIWSVLLSPHLLHTRDLVHFFCSVQIFGSCDIQVGLGYAFSFYVWYILFLFSRDFRGVEAENICICLDYFVIFLDGNFLGVSNDLFVKVGFYLISGAEEEPDFSRYPLMSSGIWRGRFLF